LSLLNAQKQRALLKARARYMLHNPTYSEARLFSAIRGKRLDVSFRRQQVIGNHIVDFLARKVSLVIEIDGDAYHRKRVAADARRDLKLRRAGYRVLRIPASLVEWDLPAAVALVREVLL
jgi:very-short-patch-repair endonuclease